AFHGAADVRFREQSGLRAAAIARPACLLTPLIAGIPRLAINARKSISASTDDPEGFSNCKCANPRSVVWRKNPNHWRAITRLGAGMQLTHQHRREPHQHPAAQAVVPLKGKAMKQVIICTIVTCCVFCLLVIALDPPRCPSDVPNTRIGEVLKLAGC